MGTDAGDVQIKAGQRARAMGRPLGAVPLQDTCALLTGLLSHGAAAESCGAILPLWEAGGAEVALSPSEQQGPGEAWLFPPRTPAPGTGPEEFIPDKCGPVGPD